MRSMTTSLRVGTDGWSRCGAPGRIRSGSITPGPGLGGSVAGRHGGADDVGVVERERRQVAQRPPLGAGGVVTGLDRSEEHTSELQSRENLVCRLLLE